MSKIINSIADLAELAGVSKSTVSRALNDNPIISKERRRSIQALAKEHQFEVHKAARGLSLKSSQTLALIVPVKKKNHYFITDPFFAELLKGVTYAASQHHYDLLIGQPRNDVEDELLRYVDTSRADGLIFLGCWYIEGFGDLIKRKIPVIAAGSDIPIDFCSVDCDNTEGGRLAARHLLDLGRKHIAFLGGVRDSIEVKQRYLGFAEELNSDSYPLDPSLVVYGDYSSESGYQETKKLIEEHQDVDAIFACSDVMAMGVISALCDSGKSIPEDVAVIGFDDIPMAQYCNPSLTTISQDIIKIGETMVNNLIQYLRDGIVTKSVMPVELVVRDSTKV